MIGLIEIFIFLGVMLFLIIFVFYLTIDGLKITPNNSINTENINEKSYQNYAKFYGNTELKDIKFNEKINKIYDLIVNKHEKNIRKIASASHCTYEECILKIRYLKNKRMIQNVYIDHTYGKILPCTPQDEILLKKYSNYLYRGHLQIPEMAVIMTGVNIENINQVKERIYKDLVYLEEKDLINGIKIDRIDRVIIYYTLEKKLKARDFISINCPNCGAINDLNRGGKVRCEYCQTIIEDEI